MVAVAELQGKQRSSDPTGRIRLPSLAAGREEWPFIVEAARAAFLHVYAPQLPVTVEIPEMVARADYPIVLAAHMAALALVDAAVRGEPAPSGSAEITEYLLGRERAYWTDLHEADPVRCPTSPVVMSRTVFTATLTRPLAYEEAVVALHTPR